MRRCVSDPVNQRFHDITFRMIAATSTYRPCPARESPALPIRIESLRLPGRARRVAEVTSSLPAAATMETERMATLAPHARPLVRRRSAPAGLQDALPRQVSFDRVSAFAWERSEGGAVAARIQDGEAGVIDEPDVTVVSSGASARVVEEPRISPPRPICRRGRMHVNPPPAPLPLGPPPSLESAPNTPAFTDDKISNKEVPQTRMGMCIVCLENDVEVLDASWLHREEEGVSRAGQNGAENGSDEKCQVSACPDCLETYFEGVVDSGFDGACPRMRCMMCPRVICEQNWRPLVDESVLNNFRRRANILLSLQCGGCHCREGLMVFPLPTQSYRAAADALMKSLMTQPVAGRERFTEDCRVENLVTGQNAAEADVESFRLALERYNRGEDVDVAKFYAKVERHVSPGTAVYPAARMADVLRCIADAERRASLHLRFLRFHPIVETSCCKLVHCFRCKVEYGHPDMTCEQFQAGRGYEHVLTCPECGVHIVRGDGCDRMACVCGSEFNWFERFREIAAEQAELFPGNQGGASPEVLRHDDPTVGEDDAPMPNDEVDGATYLGAVGDVEMGA